jgi:hypothetical protein
MKCLNCALDSLAAADDQVDREVPAPDDARARALSDHAADSPRASAPHTADPAVPRADPRAGPRKRQADHPRDAATRRRWWWRRRRRWRRRWRRGWHRRRWWWWWWRRWRRWRWRRWRWRRWRRRRWWWRRRRRRADRPAQAKHLVRGSVVEAGCPSPPTRARTEPPARVLPGRTGIRLHGAIPPAPLSRRAEVLVGLHRDPADPLPQADHRAERDREAWAVGEAFVRPGGKQCSRQAAGAVGIDLDVHRDGRPGPVEVVALDLDQVDVPTNAARDDEVVCSLVVEGVRRGLEVLGARRARGRVVVLVVEHHAGLTEGCRCERQRSSDQEPREQQRAPFPPHQP